MIDRRFLDISLVVEDVADEPEKFEAGTQYIVGENPTGDFENAEPTQIARYDGEKWIFMPAKEASLEVINAGTGEILKFDGMLWEVVAVLSGSGGSLLVVDDLAQVVASSNDRPTDYILNYCIIDNGINTPKAYEYYAHDNQYNNEMYYANSSSTNYENYVLAGDNGKCYKFVIPSKNYDPYILEASEINAGTFVLNKKCNLFYVYDGTELKLIGGNFVGVDFAGVSDVSAKWSDTDYWKHFDEIGLYISGYNLSGTLMKPNPSYDGWRSDGVTQPSETGVFFASTNHCMLYYLYKKEGYNCLWTPVAFLKKGTAIHSSFDNSMYISNGTELEKTDKEKFIAVRDICEVSFFMSNYDNSYEIGSKGLFHDTSYSNESDYMIGVYVRGDVDKYTHWKKDYDIAYGDKFIVLKEAWLGNNSKEPCIHEYVDGTGNVASNFSRYNLEAGTLIFNKNDNMLYYYDGSTIQRSSAQVEEKLSANSFSVVNRISDEPDSIDGELVKGTQYIVGANRTGDFANAMQGQIARYDGEKWNFITPKAGKMEVFNLSTNELLKFNGTDWVLKYEPDSFIRVKAIAESGTLSGNALPDTFTVNDGVISGGAKKGQKFVWHEVRPNAASYYAPYVDFYLLEVVNDRGSVIPEGSTWEKVKERSLLSVGTIFYSEADSSFYRINDKNNFLSSNSSNKNLARLAPHNTYAIEDIFDWLGTSGQWNDTTEATEGYKKFVVGNPAQFYIYQGGEWKEPGISILKDKSFTSYSSGYDNEKIIVSFSPSPYCIGYCNLSGDYKSLYMRRLYEGDIIISKADGITYKFNGTDFIAQTETKDVMPESVTAVIATGTELPKTCAKGDKFLLLGSDVIYTGLAENTWNSGINADVYKETFISKTDFKLYKNSNAYFKYRLFSSESAIEVGTTFFSKSDGKMYFFDGVDFIPIGEGKTEVTSLTYDIPPVFAIAPLGSFRDSPPVPFLDLEKGCHRVGDNGYGYAVSGGGEYVACTDDFKMYKITDYETAEDGRNKPIWEITDIPVDTPFLNEDDGLLYVYDGTEIKLKYTPVALITPRYNLNKGSSQEEWNNTSAVNNEIIASTGQGTYTHTFENVASSSDFKFYKYTLYGNGSSNIGEYIGDIPVGEPFYNKADGKLYTYDGTTIKDEDGNSPVFELDGVPVNEPYINANNVLCVFDGTSIKELEYKVVLTITSMTVFTPNSSETYSSLSSLRDEIIAVTGNSSDGKVIYDVASTGDFKFHKFNLSMSATGEEDISVNVPFYNMKDAKTYIYDGTEIKEVRIELKDETGTVDDNAFKGIDLGEITGE